MGRPKGSKNKVKRSRAPSVSDLVTTNRPQRASLKHRVDNLEVIVGAVEHRLIAIEKEIKPVIPAPVEPDLVPSASSGGGHDIVVAKLDEIIALVKNGSAVSKPAGV